MTFAFKVEGLTSSPSAFRGIVKSFADKPKLDEVVTVFDPELSVMAATPSEEGKTNFGRPRWLD